LGLLSRLSLRCCRQKWVPLVGITEFKSSSRCTSYGATIGRPITFVGS
jgi:hypothetical protein